MQDIIEKESGFETSTKYEFDYIHIQRLTPVFMYIIIELELYLCEWITFIIMKSSLHAHYWNTTKIAKNHTPCMSFDRGNWEMRYGRIRKYIRIC